MVALIALGALAADPGDRGRAPGPPETSPWDPVLDGAPPPDRLPAAGWAVRPVGGPAATSLSVLAVLGGSGGTQIASLSARAPAGKWQLGAAVPFAAYRAPATHETGLGNLAIDVDRWVGSGSLGFEAVIHVGAEAWTWGYEAPDAWPTSGGAIAWQRPVQVGEGAIVLRSSLGVYGTPGVAPVPRLYGRLNLAAAGDHPLGEHAGFCWEGGFAWYDPSPLDAAIGARVDPGKTARLRTALVLPPTIWMGAGADQRTQGIREVGWATDLTVAF
jgi:hypothetical protein